jgi:arsenite-transporting ATPase
VLTWKPALCVEMGIILPADKRVTMFCGKGGVGKTTSAAATALHYAMNGQKTLIISTDFTPSLRDIFEVDSPAKPARVTDNLYLDEISYDSVKVLWDKKFGPQVYDLFSTFVEIDYDDFVGYVATMLPGIKDEFMVDYIRETSESGKYERVVWDTAPAGQTLGLLRMPSLMNRHLKPAARVYSSLKSTQNLKRTVLGVIKDWERLSNKDMRFLREQVQFNLVTIAEALAVRQLQDIFDEFKSYGLGINHIVINQVVEGADSAFLRQKSQLQRKYLDEVEGGYGVGSTRVPLFPYEIKGVGRLKEVERRLFDSAA